MGNGCSNCKNVLPYLKCVRCYGPGLDGYPFWEPKNGKVDIKIEYGTTVRPIRKATFSENRKELSVYSQTITLEDKNHGAYVSMSFNNETFKKFAEVVADIAAQLEV